MTRSSALLTAALVAVVTAVGCESSISVHAVRSPAAHFEQYRTVAIDTGAQPPNEYSPSPQSTDAQTEIRQSVAVILASRGFALTEGDKADLVVRIEEGRRDRTVTVPALAPAPANAGETEYQAQIDQKQLDLVDGEFVIDVFDAKSKTLVWQGSAQAEVTPGKVDHARLRRAVDAVLRTFPPAGTQ